MWEIRCLFTCSAPRWASPTVAFRTLTALGPSEGRLGFLVTAPAGTGGWFGSGTGGSGVVRRCTIVFCVFGRETSTSFVQTDLVQAVWGGSCGCCGVRAGWGDAGCHRVGDHRSAREPRGRCRCGRRWWQLLARSRGFAERHGPDAVRPHRHARHRDERARAAGCARASGPGDAGAVGDRDASDRRGLHPTPRRSPPREGARRDLRGGHRQPVLHHRHRSSTACSGDRSRRGDQGHAFRRGRDLLRPTRVRTTAPSSTTKCPTWR